MLFERRPRSVFHSSRSIVLQNDFPRLHMEYIVVLGSNRIVHQIPDNFQNARQGARSGDEFFESSLHRISHLCVPAIA
jgi:hypothetical protein